MLTIRALKSSIKSSIKFCPGFCPGFTFGYNSIIVFICTDAWAPIYIFLHVSGQNESVHIKTIDTLYFVDTLQ